MNISEKRIFRVLVFCIVVLFGQACLAFSRIDPKLHKRLKEIEKQENTDMRFYGRVIDLDGNSVSGAKVTAGVGFFTPKAFIKREGGVKTKKAKTNRDGFFKLKTYGSDVYIRDIEKDGYEFLYEGHKNKERSFEYSPSLKRPFVPDKDNPIVFNLRKKGEPVFLVWDDDNYDFYLEKEATKNLSLFDIYLDSNYVSHNIPPKIKNLEIRGIPHPNDGYFEFIFTTLDANSGVLLSDEPFYVAAKDGYKKEEKLQIECSEAHYDMNKIFLQVQINDGKAYSKVTIKPRVYDDRITLFVEILTNPEGGRNLERYPKYIAKEASRRYEERRKISRKEHLLRKKRYEEIQKEKKRKSLSRQRKK